MITATQIINRKETLNDYHKDHIRTGKIFNFKRYGTDMIIINEVIEWVKHIQSRQHR